MCIRDRPSRFVLQCLVHLLLVNYQLRVSWRCSDLVRLAVRRTRSQPLHQPQSLRSVDFDLSVRVISSSMHLRICWHLKISTSSKFHISKTQRSKPQNHVMARSGRHVVVGNKLISTQHNTNHEVRRTVANLSTSLPVFLSCPPQRLTQLRVI